MDASSDGRQAIEELCRRLDGMPLAIELAAARARSIAPLELLHRLDDRFRLLTRPGQAAASRQATLEATIAWSYSMLHPDEQATLQRLAVFRGGFTLPAAAAVCADIGAELETIERVGDLVDKSLLQIQDRIGGRYRLLESIGLFAEQRLLETELHLAEAVRARHADYFCGLAKTLSPLMNGADAAFAFTQTTAELENLRACVEWTMHHEPARALELTLDLDRYWIHVRLREGRQWLTKSIASAPADTELRCRGLYDLSFWKAWEGEFAWARELAAECVETSRRIGDRRYEALGLNASGSIANLDRRQGWEHEALPLLEQAEHLIRQIDADRDLALVLNNHGYYLLEAGYLDRAREKLTESARVAGRCSDTVLLAAIHGSLADVEMAARDLPAADRHWREELRIGGEFAGIALKEALTGLAGLAFEEGNWTRCLRLLGAASELPFDDRLSTDPGIVQKARTAAARELGPAASEDLWREGTRMTIAEAVAFGLETSERETHQTVISTTAISAATTPQS